MAPASTSPPAVQPSLRQKRIQVARACDWCRKHRIKCDDNRPCSPCRKRGAGCSNEAINTTLPHASREIEQLRRQVQDLQHQLQLERSKGKGPGHASPHELPTNGLGLDYGHLQKFWRGIRIKTARSPHETWYGPSSLFYFVGRVTNFLNGTLNQTRPAHEMLTKPSPDTLFDTPTAVSRNNPNSHIDRSIDDPTASGVYLSSTQEEYFLDLFWQSYHACLLPVLDEEEFKEHYRSLWTTPGDTRNPSARVDILIALCMQYGVSMLPSANQKVVEKIDATVAGRWYYRRCRKLLAYEMERPTLSTLQCHILCCVYLCNGSFLNMADCDCGLAVRTAYMLGLHAELHGISQREQEMRKRIWWSLYMMDTKIGMKLGRPFLLSQYQSNAGPSLLDDGREAAANSGSHFAALGGGYTWLSYHFQLSNLFVAARALYTAFYSRRLNIRDDQTIWDDLDVLETHAKLLYPYTRALDNWAKGVPDALRTKRKGGGCSFSTDGSMLDIEQFAPLWLQRQRLLLELAYHNQCINLYRPFIAFTGSSPTPTLTEQTASRCALHANAMTSIMHQVLLSTSLLAGWHEAFQWQWNAALTLVGFVLAYPRGESTPVARKAIDLSVAIFDHFGNNFGAACEAANIVRDLGAKVNFLQQSQRADAAVQQPRAGLEGTNGGLLVLDGPPLGRVDDVTSHFDAGDMAMASVQDVFQMTLAVDQWRDLDLLWPSEGLLSDQGWAETF